MASSHGQPQAVVMASAVRPGAQASMTTSVAAPVVTTTDSSIEAWKRHVDALSEADRSKFLSHQEGDLNAYISKLKFHSEKQAEKSSLRKISKYLQPIFDTTQMYMGPVGAALQAHPNPSTLIIGGVMCIVQVNANFTSFHENSARDLMSMFRKAGILTQIDNYLYQNDPAVRLALVEVYGDILKYCEELWSLLVNSKGETRGMGKIALKSLVENYQGKFRSILEQYNDDLAYLKDLSEFSNIRRTERFHEQAFQGISLTGQGIRAVHNEALVLGEATRTIGDEVFSPSHGVRKIHDELSSMHHGVRVTKDEVSAMKQSVLAIGGDVSSVDHTVRAVKGDVSMLRRGIQTIQDRSLIELLGSRRAERRKKRKDILQWLPSISFVEEQDRKRKERLEGTGQWLLENTYYETWKTRDDSDLLRVTGKAGCGKSFLANSVIDDLEDDLAPNGAIAYVYCNARKTDQDSVTVLGSILKQLCLVTPRIDPKLELIYDKASEAQNGPNSTQVQESMVSIMAAFSETYIVVDGLDEHDERGWISDFFRKLVSNTFGTVKVIIFSRLGYADIDKHFAQYPSLVVDSDKNKEDIRRYISALLNDENFPIPSDSHRIDEIREKVLTKADGMFLYVKLLMKALMDQETPKEVMKIIEALPDELKNVYDLHMQRIIRRSKGKQETAFRVLFWTANAKRPLTRAEMVEAVSLAPGMVKLEKDDLKQNEREFTSLCADLVFVDNDECYRLIHTTLHEYLRKLAENRPPEYETYYKKEINAGKILGELCLTYLLFEQFREYDYDSMDAIEQLKGVHPLLEYAASFWGRHVEQVAEEALRDRIIEFFGCPKAFQLSMQILLQSRGNKVCDQPQTITNFHALAIFGLLQISRGLSFSELLRSQADDCGRLPFDYALLGQQEQMALWISKTGEQQGRDEREVNIVQSRYSWLHCAAILNWPEVVNALILQGHDIDSRSGTQELTPLEAASELGSELAVKCLLAWDAKVNVKAKGGSTALIYAARQNHQGIVKVLLERAANVDDADNDGATALHYAAKKGNKEIATLLVDAKADIRKKMTGLNQETPLHLTGRVDSVEIAKLLKPKDEDLEARTSQGYTPLHYASQFDSVLVVEYLIKCGAEIDPRDGDLWTPLHIAAYFGCLRVCTFLVETAGACVTATNNIGSTPLHLAAETGHLEIVSLLLKNNAKLDVLNENGITPLHKSLIPGDKEMVRLILAHVGDPMNNRSHANLSVLHYAAHFGHKHLIDILLDAGAIPNATDKFGNTVVHLGASRGKLEFLERLCEFVSIDLLEQINDNGQSPLHLAALNGHLLTVRFLLDKGAKSTATNVGNLPIHLAALNGHESVVSELITAESLQAHGYHQQTALYMAAQEGHLQVVKLLQRHGANINAVDEDGVTPAISAIDASHLAVVNFLVDKGANVKISRHTDGFTLLHGATEIENDNLVRKLLEAECDGLHRMANGQTPFLAAAASGRVGLLQLFLDKKFDGSRDKTKSGVTCVHAAAQTGDIAILEKLLELGADLHAVDCNGMNAVSYAAQSGNHVLIDYFARRDVNLEESAVTQVTPLHLAARNANFEVVDLILKHGAKFDTKIIGSGLTPLHVAAAKGFSLTVDKLLAHGADPFSRDAYGLNSLDYASRYPLCLRRFRGLMHSYQPLGRTERMKLLKNTIMTTIQSALAPRVLDMHMSVVERSTLLEVLAYSLIYFEDHPEHERAKLCFSELFFPPENSLVAVSFDCGLCAATMYHEDVFICTECFETYFCERCYNQYSKGFKSPNSLPEFFQSIEDIEREVFPVQCLTINALRDGPPFSYKVMHFMVNLEEWFAEIHRRYKEWHQKHNPNDEFRTYPQESYKFVELVRRLLNEIYATFGSTGATDGTTPEIDKILGELLEMHTPEREFREVVCAKHEFICISWDKWQETRANSDFAVIQDGKLADLWLEELLRCYESLESHDSSDENSSETQKIEKTSNSDENAKSSSACQPQENRAAYEIETESEEMPGVLGTVCTSETDIPILKLASHVWKLLNLSGEGNDIVFFFSLCELSRTYYSEGRLIEAEALETLELETWIRSRDNKPDRQAVSKYQSLIATKVELQKPLEALRLVNAALDILNDIGSDDEDAFEDLFDSAVFICKDQELLRQADEIQENLLQMHRDRTKSSEFCCDKSLIEMICLIEIKIDLGDIEGAISLFGEAIGLAQLVDDEGVSLDEALVNALFSGVSRPILFPKAEEAGEQLLQKRILSANDDTSNAKLRLTLKNLAFVKFKLGKLKESQNLAFNAWSRLKLNERRSDSDETSTAIPGGWENSNGDFIPEWSEVVPECRQELEELIELLICVFYEAGKLEAVEALEILLVKLNIAKDSDDASDALDLFNRLTALTLTMAKRGKVEEARSFVEDAVKLLSEEVREEERKVMEAKIQELADEYASQASSTGTNETTELYAIHEQGAMLTEEPLEIRDELNPSQMNAKISLMVPSSALLKFTPRGFLHHGHFESPASTKRLLRIQGLLKESFSESMDGYLDRPVRKFSDGVD